MAKEALEIEQKIISSLYPRFIARKADDIKKSASTGHISRPLPCRLFLYEVISLVGNFIGCNKVLLRKRKDSRAPY